MKILVKGELMEGEKIQYLQMIQEVIGRMSTISSVVKGFTITIAVAVATILSGGFVENWMFWIFALPLLSLLMLDVYYLTLERKYRLLFDDVRIDKHPVDYSLTLTQEINDQVPLWKCLISKSILMFHFPILIMYILICFLIKQ